MKRPGLHVTDCYHTRISRELYFCGRQVIVTGLRWGGSCEDWSGCRQLANYDDKRKGETCYINSVVADLNGLARCRSIPGHARLSRRSPSGA